MKNASKIYLTVRVKNNRPRPVDKDVTKRYTLRSCQNFHERFLYQVLNGSARRRHNEICQVLLSSVQGFRFCLISLLTRVVTAASRGACETKQCVTNVV